MPAVPASAYAWRVDLLALYGLTLATPALELRLPSEEELVVLARVAEAGVHPPGEMPFLIPWTDPSETFVSDFVAYHLDLRANWQPASWHLELAVFLDGKPIGAQGLIGEDFPLSRTVSTGSWLGLPFQRHGYGTAMRTAVLELAFSGLGARSARSGVLEGNTASDRVSAKLGYEQVGEEWPIIRGRPVRERTYSLDRATYLRSERAPVSISGLAECRALFGIPDEQ